jgi:hypothetical protein
LKLFYELYVRLLIWLGAEPPEGYEYLLPVAERMKTPSTATSTLSAQEEHRLEDEDSYISEEDLPGWLQSSDEDTPEWLPCSSEEWQGNERRT